MKPSAVLFALMFAWLAGVRTVDAQSPTSQPDPDWLARGKPVAAEHEQLVPLELWGPPPLPPLPYAHWWQEYQGATIVHDPYGTRRHASHYKSHQHRPAFCLFGCWLDNLFTLLTPRKRGCCPNCQSQAYSPALPAVQSEGASDSGFYPIPAPPESAPDPRPSEVKQPALVTPQPANVNVAPPVPEPATPARPAVNSTVVELAPDPVIPGEAEAPAEPQPPRNRLPAPADRLPKNPLPR